MCERSWSAIWATSLEDGRLSRGRECGAARKPSAASAMATALNRQLPSPAARTRVKPAISFLDKNGREGAGVPECNIVNPEQRSSLEPNPVRQFFSGQCTTGKATYVFGVDLLESLLATRLLQPRSSRSGQLAILNAVGDKFGRTVSGMP